MEKVFQNTINKKINNNEEYSISKNIEKHDKMDVNINTKINNMFKSKNYIYKINAIITLKDKEVKKVIIGKNRSSLITIDNEIIPINDIIDINYTN